MSFNSLVCLSVSIYVGHLVSGCRRPGNGSIHRFLLGFVPLPQPFSWIVHPRCGLQLDYDKVLAERLDGAEQRAPRGWACLQSEVRATHNLSTCTGMEFLAFIQSVVRATHNLSTCNGM
jgi:hypothetical protein